MAARKGAQTTGGWIALLVAFSSLILGCGPSPAPTAAGRPALPAHASPGVFGDTWTWNGSQWRLTSIAGPSARESPGLAYDQEHHQFVLYGGLAATGQSDETWTWDGRAWRALSPLHKPRARGDVAMAYDSRTHRVVLYGGIVLDRGEGSAGDDTWTWDGNDWTPVVSTGPSPGRRVGARLVATGDGLILFGGHDSNVDYYGDAWSWDGGRWTALGATPAPPGRGDAAVAWDAARAAVVVFGGTGFRADAGIGAQGTLLSDTWSLKDRSWTAHTGSGPAPTSNAVAIWNQDAKRVEVLLGRACPRLPDATWAWDGRSWTRLGPSGIPPRAGAAVAQDSTGAALLFGGSDLGGC